MLLFMGPEGINGWDHRFCYLVSPSMNKKYTSGNSKMLTMRILLISQQPELVEHSDEFSEI